ncbi:hypothetical protein DM813_09690 [Pseudomonas alkylphenolica]|uniref:Uncharacterized protein n=1 Tax=Pseudomonas alkylphenolica TaxID=237609 RepID=A0A443ZVJ3_9PSED|nr:hypothetical protein [Pseudomonas alkylphenolica]RWU24075.1 hypothetical protein DM813_09690 [Pseudomonas alkylphenolica]
MQVGTEENPKIIIALKSAAEDCHVVGFTDKYAAYLEGQDAGAVPFGRLLLFTGFSVSVVGLATLIFGPSIIYYDRQSGPTVLEYIQMYPGPITTVGGVFCALGGNLISKGPMTREAFLQANYSFIGYDGRDVSSEVDIRHLADDNFNVSIKP